MKNTRRLWASIVFVIVLTSAVDRRAGERRDLARSLGLDLQGGVAVILSAPDGTPGRRDGDGAGEHPPPRRRVRRRRARHLPVRDHDRDPDPGRLRQHGGGAFGGPHVPRRRRRHLRVRHRGGGRRGARRARGDEPALEVCIVTADGEDLDCLSDQQQADTALAGYSVQPEDRRRRERVTPSASPAPSEGPDAPAASYCLTDAEGEQPVVLRHEGRGRRRARRPGDRGAREAVLHHAGASRARGRCRRERDADADPDPHPDGLAVAVGARVVRRARPHRRRRPAVRLRDRGRGRPRRSTASGRSR